MTITRRLEKLTDEFGEQYRIDCPCCGDIRKRCFVGHTYGTRDLRTGFVNWSAWYCHNEQCQSERANRDRLRGQLDFTPQRFLYRVGSAGATPQSTAIESPPVIVPLPAGLRPLVDLSEDHPAVEYVRQRGFDPVALHTLWDLSYLPADGSMYGHRLVIPITRPVEKSSVEGVHVELGGWQARALSDPADATRKYLFPAGMQKSKLLYGLPQALAADGPVIVCEGATDVWRVGPGAVALLGKSISDTQRSLLVKCFVGRPMVLLLDSDVRTSFGMAVLLRRERSSQPGDNRVVTGELPSGRKDPAECTRAEIEACLAAALRAGA